MNDNQLVPHLRSRLALVEDCLRRIRDNTDTDDQVKEQADYIAEQLGRLVRAGKEALNMAKAISCTFQISVDLEVKIVDD